MDCRLFFLKNESCLTPYNLPFLREVPEGERVNRSDNYNHALGQEQVGCGMCFGYFLKNLIYVYLISRQRY